MEPGKVRKAFQRTTAKLALKGYGCNWENRVEKKLKRWNLVGVRRRWRDAFMGNMEGLSKLVAPRVAAAVFGLAWNRWCTARRFQQRSVCKLGCGRGSDSAEHYCGCAVARDVGWRKLRLDKEENYDERKKSLMGANKVGKDDATCYAILAYAIFRTIGNNMKSAGSCEEKKEEIAQHIRNAVEGHVKSAQVVKGRWLTVVGANGE